MSRVTMSGRIRVGFAAIPGASGYVKSIRNQGGAWGQFVIPPNETRTCRLLHCCCTGNASGRRAGTILSSKLAPGRRFELRTLRLTARCGRFETSGPNSLRAATCRQMPRFATGAAVRQRSPTSHQKSRRGRSSDVGAPGFKEVGTRGRAARNLPQESARFLQATDHREKQRQVSCREVRRGGGRPRGRLV